MQKGCSTIMAAYEISGDRPRGPETEPILEPIECNELDPQHVRWLNQYVAYCQSLLGEELAVLSPDLLMVGYLKREIQRYQRLIGLTAPTSSPST